jgi:hypothetical protein
MQCADSFRTDDYEAAVEEFYRQGWTDGLPVVLPTRGLVERMITASGRDRNESLGHVTPRNGKATIEMLAINAVMGGCLPEYFPVVLAAFEAMQAPQHNLNGVTQTTHPCVPLAIVNGPVARRLQFNSRTGVFGNGFRANAAVGRALRLALWNLGGAVPWETDMATMSHPGEFTFCIAEEEETSPWAPLHVERGFAAGTSAVTVFACEAPQSVLCQGTPAEMLYVLCDNLATLGNNNTQTGGQTLVVLNPRIAREFAQAGWSKHDVRLHLWENARRTSSELRECGEHQRGQRKGLIQTGRTLARYDWDGPDKLIPVTDRPEDILIVVAGGDTYFAAVLPGWGSYGGYAATAAVREPSTH